MNENKEICEGEEVKNSNNDKFTLKNIIKIVFKSVICIALMGALVNVMPAMLNGLMSIVFLIICGGIVIYNINNLKKYIKYRNSNKAKKDWCDMNSKEKTKYIFKTILSIILQWVVVIAILVWLGSYYGDELIAKLDGENTYKEAVLDTNLNDGVTLEDACENFFGNYKSKYFKTSDDLNIVEVSGKAYFMDKKVDVDIQFIANSRDIGDFKVYTATINDVPQSMPMTQSLYKAICDSHMNITTKNEDKSKKSDNNIKHSSKEDEMQSHNPDVDDHITLDDTLYGEWVSDNGSDLVIDKDYIYGSTYSVEKKIGDMYIVKVNNDGGYKIGIKPTEKGIIIYNYNEETNSFNNGISYYNSGI